MLNEFLARFVTLKKTQKNLGWKASGLIVTHARPRIKRNKYIFLFVCSFYFNSFGSLSLSIVYYPSANELAIVSVSFSTDKQGTLTISNETHNFQFLIKKYISKISFSLKSLRDFEYRPFISSHDHAGPHISYTG